MTDLPDLPEWMRLAEPFASAAKEYGQQCRDAAWLEAAELCDCDEAANLSPADLAAVLRAKVKK